MSRDFESDSSEFYRDKDLSGLEIRRSFYRRSAFSKHTHDAASLGVILRGEGTYVRKGGAQAISAGCVIFIPRDEAHACNPQKGSCWEYLMFHIRERYLRELAGEMTGREPREVHLPAPVFRDPALHRRMVHLYALVKESASLLEKEAALIDTIAGLLLRHARLGSRVSRNLREPRSVTMAKDYLAATLEKNVTMKELSEATGLNGFHLLHVFRHAVGMPPHAYQVQMRVAKARGLLLNGYSIVESALETGFYDQSHFTKKFKRVVGLTPREFVLAHRSS